MTAIPTVLASYAHNEALAEKWLKVNGIESTAARVTEQLPCLPFNRHGIERFAYNGSLIAWRERMLLSYRFHAGSPATRLAIAELDDKWNVRHKKPLVIDAGGGSYEDCTLFCRGSELWASWVQSTWPKSPPQSVVRCGEVVETKETWTVPKAITPLVGKNDWSAMEKNWIPMGDSFIYQQTPKQVVHQLEGNEIKASWECPFPHWPWGVVKGGTSPVPFKGNLLSFAHSTLDNEPGQWRRRYYMLAVVREPVPPFKVVGMSKRPVCRGSELGSLTQTERAGCSHFKGLVVFPLGCVAMADGWLVSVGVNDSEVAILKVTEEDLKL